MPRSRPIARPAASRCVPTMPRAPTARAGRCACTARGDAMALEDLTGPSKFINALVIGNPVSIDDRREGDDHLRGIKNVLRNQFPSFSGAITYTHAEVNTAIGKGLAADATYMAKSANLSDVSSVGTARTNLSVYSKAEADAAYMAKAQNLNDVANKATARTNLDVNSKAEDAAGFVARGAAGEGARIVPKTLAGSYISWYAMDDT